MSKNQARKVTGLEGIDSINEKHRPSGLQSSVQVFDILKYVKKIADEREHENIDCKLWRVKDLAEFLKMSEGHIYNLSAQGKIPKLKKGKTLFFKPRDILNWLQNGEQL